MMIMTTTTTTTTTRPRLEELARRWRLQAIARDVLFALAAGLALAAVSLVWPALPWLVPCAGFCLVLASRLTLSRPWALNAALLARHFDRVHPALEESSTLWLRPPESLTLLERLQLQRLERAVQSITTPKTAAFGAPPRSRLTPAWVCLLGGTLAVILAATVAIRGKERRIASHAPFAPSAQPARAVLPASAPLWPKIIGSELSIVPPAYTGRPPRRVDGWNAEVEEGATVTWRLGLNRPVREARLVFGDAQADVLPLHPTPAASEHFAGSRPVTDASLYHLSGVLPDGTAWSPPELFSLRIIRDRPPTLRILQPALPRTILDSAAVPLTVECLAADDYGLVDAHLVATVAKGAGEAVKFREQTIAFDTDQPAAATAPGAHRLLKTLDLAALGLEAGDELYFFVEGRDNRQPVANHARSETRFITIKGPNDIAPAGGLGVSGINLVPKYFRSERQLIIDTEKLVADQPALPVPEFSRRANDLGIDQGMLRLRYGQFVGEVLEQSPGADHVEVPLDPLQAAPVERSGPRAAASVAMRFLQEHIEQDRDGVDPEHDTGSPVAHDHPLTATQVRAPFVDEHDSQDKATLFDHDTKGTLEDALGNMWKAEGYLRTARPQEALPSEHRALEILKDLQQSARAYVQHVGFDAPPLKIAERRLQGDVADVPPRVVIPPTSLANPGSDALADVRAALAEMNWEAPTSGLTPAQSEALRRVEPALTAAATRKPDTFLAGLRALRQLSTDPGLHTEDTRRALEQALWHLLPAATPLPERRMDPAPSLAQPYFQALSAGGDGAASVP